MHGSGAEGLNGGSCPTHTSERGLEETRCWSCGHGVCTPVPAPELASEVARPSARMSALVLVRLAPRPAPCLDCCVVRAAVELKGVERHSRAALQAPNRQAHDPSTASRHPAPPKLHSTAVVPRSTGKPWKAHARLPADAAAPLTAAHVRPKSHGAPCCAQTPCSSSPHAPLALHCNASAWHGLPLEAAAAEGASPAGSRSTHRHPAAMQL